MISAETWFEIHDKEHLAIVEAFKTWCHYLKSCKHKVFVLTNQTTTVNLSISRTWASGRCNRLKSSHDTISASITINGKLTGLQMLFLYFDKKTKPKKMIWERKILGHSTIYKFCWLMLVYQAWKWISVKQTHHHSIIS